MSNPSLKTAYFAGGCFWCMEAAFEKKNGVTQVVSGYMGGTGEHPIYSDYADKGYIETVQVTYNPKHVTYEELLDLFWRSINPTDAQGQFVDRGPQYRSAIFYQSREEQAKAQESKEKLDASGRFEKPIATELLQASTFYPAETYHQNYYKKNPIRYRWYYYRSGREQFFNKIWGAAHARKQSTSHQYQKPSKRELKQRLTLLQYRVTQEGATEPPFDNPYWDNTKPGIYVDIVSGEPLFSTIDQFKSDTGWPSFSKPLEPKNIVERKKWFRSFKKVRSKQADSHLGDLFQDGPPPTGLRYCINSAALRFIPVENLEKTGYGHYRNLFTVQTTAASLALDK